MTIANMEAPADIPEGFRVFDLPFEDGFIGQNGPLYIRRDEAGALVFGSRIRARHCNPMRICHGGWMATLMDMVLPLNARMSVGLEENYLLTVAMTLDYLGGAQLGAWIEGRGRVLRKTKRLVFSEAMLTVEGEPILRGSGVYRIGPESPRLTVD